MSEEQIDQNLADNVEEVANLQEEETILEVDTSESTTGTTQVNTEEDVTQTQAFSRRLKESTEKARQEERDALIAEMYSDQGIHTYADYQKAIQQEEQIKERERLLANGIDPDYLNEVIENHPDIQYAREMKNKELQYNQLQNEGSALFKEFPNLDVNSIPDEVYQLKKELGIPLLYAYKSVMFNNVKSTTEQELLKKLSTNATNSPGSLGESGNVTKSNISQMSKTDFSQVMEEVLRGERKQL